jgi:hypothetical protein
MIEARLALPGQSTPGPDACSLATARADNASSVSAVRHPAWGTSGSSAPPAASRARATSADRSAGQPPGRSGCSARPCRRQPGASRPGAQPASAALQAPSTRCSAAAASATSASARLAHLCRSDRGHRIPGSGACCGRAPTRSRRSYRRHCARSPDLPHHLASRSRSTKP